MLLTNVFHHDQSFCPGRLILFFGVFGVQFAACVCVCVCVWANRCDQSATVDNWEAQASAVVEVHRVLLVIVIVVVVTMVVHVSR